MSQELFDPKTFSNEELFEKQLDLIRRKLLAARIGKMDIAEQMQNMIQAIDNERRERMFQQHFGNYILNSSSVVIETDPDLRERQIQAEEELNQKKSNQNKKPIRRPVRTAKPVTPKSDDGVI